MTVDHEKSDLHLRLRHCCPVAKSFFIPLGSSRLRGGVLVDPNWTTFRCDALGPEMAHLRHGVMSDLSP